jgi:predicted Rossmann-fold nucleotide-binding protein
LTIEPEHCLCQGELSGCEDAKLKYKLGIYGSNITEGAGAVEVARQLGSALAKNNVLVVTGGCSGMPYTVAHAARQEGAEVWGFTPEHDEMGQRRAYPHDDITIYNRLFYVPGGYSQHFFLEQELTAAADYATRLKYRNVISTMHVDAGIIISGGWGTLNEFTNLIYDGKPIGVLTGTGGLADEMPAWFPRLRKKSESRVFFSQRADELVGLLLSELNSK